MCFWFINSKFHDLKKILQKCYFNEGNINKIKSPQMPFFAFLTIQVDRREFSILPYINHTHTIKNYLGSYFFYYIHVFKKFSIVRILKTKFQSRHDKERIMKRIFDITK